MLSGRDTALVTQDECSSLGDFPNNSNNNRGYNLVPLDSVETCHFESLKQKPEKCWEQQIKRFLLYSTELNFGFVK